MSVVHAASLEGCQASIGCLATAETASDGSSSGSGASAQGRAGDGSSVVVAGEWEGGLSIWDVKHASTFARDVESVVAAEDDEDEDEDEMDASGETATNTGTRSKGRRAALLSAAPIL